MAWQLSLIMLRLVYDVMIKPVQRICGFVLYKLGRPWRVYQERKRKARNKALADQFAEQRAQAKAEQEAKQQAEEQRKAAQMEIKRERLLKALEID